MQHVNSPHYEPSMSFPTLSSILTGVQDYRTSSPLPLGRVNQLQEALALHPDVKPRSLEWCLKLIDALYKSKRAKVRLMLS